MKQKKILKPVVFLTVMCMLITMLPVEISATSTTETPALSASFTLEDVLAGLADPSVLIAQSEGFAINQIQEGMDAYSLLSTTAIETGQYYLNNKNSGKYLKYDSTVASCGSGLIADLGDSIRWVIAPGGDGYVIYSLDDTSKFLAVPTSTTSSAVEIVTVGGSGIPSRCIWDISLATGGGCLVQSLYNSKYLYNNGTTITTNTLGETGTTQYYSSVWRLASTSYYGDTSSTTKRELSVSTNISNMELAKQDSQSVTINKYYSNELWVDPTDFDYSFSDNTKASYSSATGKISAIQYGGVTVTAIHKPTNLSKSFYIIVGYSSTISNTPLASHITEGLNQPYDVWPASEESRYYGFTNSQRTTLLTNIYENAHVTVVGGYISANPNAGDMLLHFLNNTGATYTVDMKEMIDEWDTAQGYRQDDMNNLISAIEVSASYSNQTIKTIQAIGHNVSEGTDWGRAVGSYTISVSCTYRKTSSTGYTATVEYKLHDVYDWDKTITSMGNMPVSPSDMWELHHGGLSKNYEVNGLNSFTITWSEGSTWGNGVTISNEA